MGLEISFNTGDLVKIFPNEEHREIDKLLGLINPAKPYFYGRIYSISGTSYYSSGKVVNNYELKHKNFKKKADESSLLILDGLNDIEIAEPLLVNDEVELYYPESDLYPKLYNDLNWKVIDIIDTETVRINSTLNNKGGSILTPMKVWELEHKTVSPPKPTGPSIIEQWMLS